MIIISLLEFSLKFKKKLDSKNKNEFKGVMKLGKIRLVVLIISNI
jgi:hypothetical protein